MGLGLGWESWTLRPHLGLGPLDGVSVMQTVNMIVRRE